MASLTSFAATAGNGSITINWTWAGSANPYYVVFIDGWPIPSQSDNQVGPAGVPAQITSPFTVTEVFTDPENSASYANLTNGTQYSITIQVFSDATRASFIEESAPSFVTPTAGGAVCFLGNAPVLTPAGYQRIDSLSAGDMVRTADGRDVAIQRVKHQRVLSPSADVNPYMIPKGMWGATETLAISPRHCVAVPGRGMVEARELGLRQLPMTAAFDYYNLELPEWDNMVVAGVEVESLAPRKRVVMTATEFRRLVSKAGHSVDMSKLASIANILSDGRVEVSLTRKMRRMI